MTAFDRAVRGGAITLARCWRLECRDGTVLGFTDHDEPLRFAGTLFEAATGLDAAMVETRLGLSVEDTEIAGALQSAAITEADISRGRYDGATVIHYMADWTDPAAHRRMGTWTVGEIVRTDGAFRAELRGLVERLERSNARRFTRRCDAELADSRCGVAMTGARRIETAVLALDGGVVVPDPDLAANTFAHGTVEWTSGANRGTRSRIARAVSEANGLLIHLWQQPAAPIAPGDALVLYAGCDKTLATCTGRFNNALNYRGFPYLPDEGAAYRYVTAEDRHDGGPLVE